MANTPISNDDLFLYSKELNIRELIIYHESEVDFHGVIALHNTYAGPAIGGCRFIEYDDFSKAIYDAIRLAQGMAHKAALANLPHGGAKAVIVKPKGLIDTKPILKAFGQVLNRLHGRYLTAVDSGTTPGDMDVIATQSPHVLCTTLADGTPGDPSPYTALGVLESMEGTLNFFEPQQSLSNMTIAIQGIGNVGYHLCKLLHKAGATLIVADRNEAACLRAQKDFGAKVVSLDEILRTPCDILSPCALGAIFNAPSIAQLSCRYIIGAANNQLATPEDGERLVAAGIHYIPDYVVNAGGLMYASSLYHQSPTEELLARVHQIADTIHEILTRSKESGIAPYALVNTIAEERIAQAAKHPVNL